VVPYLTWESAGTAVAHVSFAVSPMVVALSALIQVCVPMSAVLAVRMPRNKAARKKIGTHFEAEVEDSSSPERVLLAQIGAAHQR
jgi:predicted Co/Zn/Cd cation transporter (cation efflux family)